jgi:thiol-disulfide isomerase/thioredoxin
MKKWPVVVFVVLSALVVYWLGAAPSARTPETGAAPVAHEGAVALSEPALSGGTVALSSYAGKVVLVDFWATWCAPCVEELPDLVALRGKLAPKGFEILGVSMDDDADPTVRRFLRKHPIPYPILLNGGERPPDGWDVPGLPTAYLIGRDGTVLKRWFGEKDIPELERAVEAALAAK